MKIVLTGGGTGGHFYPLIAVAEEINSIIEEKKIIDMKMYYLSDSPYDKGLLLEHQIIFEEVSSGKSRIYKSSKNIIDRIKTFLGIFQSLIKLFLIFPDVVFSKGGYASFPVIVAARILRIPVFMHESDSSPGRVSLYTSKFAKRIAVSYAEVGEFFPKEKVAWTGQPIRREIQTKSGENAHEYWKLDPSKPTIWVTGGSQGASIINNAIIEALPELLKKYQIIHQVGNANTTEVSGLASVVLGENSPQKEYYKIIGTMNPIQEKTAAGIASCIISRAGSTIFEIALWGVPSIIIPITNSNGDHQRKNAFNYARTGACVVIEEPNLTPSILLEQLDKIVFDKPRTEFMSKNALAFSKKDAAKKIANEIIEIALFHER